MKTALRFFHLCFVLTSALAGVGGVSHSAWANDVTQKNESSPPVKYLPLKSVPHLERLGGMCQVPTDPVAAEPIKKLNEELKAISLKETAEERETAFNEFLVNEKGINPEVIVAKREEQLQEHPEWVRFGLSGGEMRAISDYTGIGYNNINPALRNCDLGVVKKFRAYTATLNSALLKFPDFKGWVRRGIDLGGPIPNEMLNQYKVGSNVIFTGFTSTSKKMAFPGNVKMLIQSKHGKDISEFSELPEEGEVLFRSGTRFRLLNRKITLCEHAGDDSEGAKPVCEMELVLKEID